MTEAERALQWLLLQGSVCIAPEFVEPVTVAFPPDGEWIVVPAEFHDIVRTVLDA